MQFERLVSMELEFCVTIDLDDEYMEIPVVLDIESQEYLKVRQCIRLAEDLDEFEGLENLCQRIIEEAKSLVAEDEDLDLDNEEYEISLTEDLDALEEDDEEDDELDMEELMENHSSDRFAIETLNWEIVSFDDQFQKEAFEKYLQIHDISEKDAIYFLEENDAGDHEYFLQDMETLGVASENGALVFDTMLGETNLDIRDLLDELGWKCEMDGESWKFESVGVLYIE